MVLSVPDLAPYLYGVLVGIPSVSAGLAALLVTSKRAVTPSVGIESGGADPDARAMRKKQLWIGGGALAAVGLLVVIVVAFAGRGKASDDELYFRPGPVALTADDFELIEGGLRPGQLVSAEWDGAWFGARVLSATNDGARVRFIGWEAAWDEELTREHLRTLPDHLVPQMNADSKQLAGRLGTTLATPCAFVLSLYQPEAASTLQPS